MLIFFDSMPYLVKWEEPEEKSKKTNQEANQENEIQTVSEKSQDEDFPENFHHHND